MVIVMSSDVIVTMVALECNVVYIMLIMTSMAGMSLTPKITASEKNPLSANVTSVVQQ